MPVQGFSAPQVYPELHWDHSPNLVCSMLGLAVQARDGSGVRRVLLPPPFLVAGCRNQSLHEPTFSRAPSSVLLPFFGGRAPTKIDYRKKGTLWYPSSNLSTGGPSLASPYQARVGK